MSDENLEGWSDPKQIIFGRAFRTTVRNVRTDIGINRAAYTRQYLEVLASEEPEIASFTVSEIIEHLNRHL